MGNLGLYQSIVTVSKAVGGPQNLILIIGAVGYAAGKATEAGVKKAVPIIKRKMEQLFEEPTEVYLVTKEVTDEQGLTLRVEDKIRILESDGETILIEVIGDNNSPYFIALDTLNAAIEQDTIISEKKGENDD